MWPGRTPPRTTRRPASSASIGATSSTIAGQLAQEVVFPPGQSTDLPLGVRFNLIQFFGNDGKVLFDTALVLSGQRTTTRKVALRLTPTIESPLGPIRYPVPITLDLGAAN
jgi:hypothetical protein